MDKVLIPVHLGNHWCLAVINFVDKRFEYYDSLGGENPKCLEVFVTFQYRLITTSSIDKISLYFFLSIDSKFYDFFCCELQRLRRYVKDEYRTKHRGEYDLSQWQDYTPLDIPHQQNGYDCGVFMCKFADYLSRYTHPIPLSNFTTKLQDSHQ
jgi:sentrin-specific protease 1